MNILSTVEAIWILLTGGPPLPSAVSEEAYSLTNEIVRKEVMKYCSFDNCGSQRGDDIHFPQFEHRGRDLAPQGGQVILIHVCDFLDQTMFAQSLEQPRYLMGALAGQITTDITILKSADVELPLDDGPEEIKVIAIEKVEPAIVAGLLLDGSGDFVQGPYAATWIINSGDEVKCSSQ